MAANNDESVVDHDFEKRVNGIAQSGFTALSIAAGSALGLFNTMATLGEAKTSTEIADAAGLKERYVREWLGAMAVARIVEVDLENDTFYLPPDRRKALCTTQGGGALAVLCEGIPRLSEVYKDVKECFNKDGPRGVPHSKYTLDPPFCDAMTSIRLGGKAPKYLTDDEEIKIILETSSVICEIGCGSGSALCLLARDFPQKEFHGVDLMEDCIAKAKSRAASMQLSNITFHLGDAVKSEEREDWRLKFDLVYCRDLVHDLSRPDLFLKGVKDILKDIGYFVMVEVASHSKLADNIDTPKTSFLYTSSLFRCLPMSLAGDGESMTLGALWGRERALEMLAEASFDCFHTQRFGIYDEAFYCRKLK
ncbi:S-adenosylmethionine-dependent methyltransferase Rv2258c-like [Ptychodera flava]|uniref:S-adenosylmethionine-dependent methyltransferase Rv2258c-like n=1 Tax=Ptychodera flava TaxID=63121 RepID=UPI00396A1481